MRKELTVFLVLALAGCATGQQAKQAQLNRHYNSFDDAMGALAEYSVPEDKYGSDRPKMVQCMAQAVQQGVPLDDRQMIVDVMNGAPVTQASDATFERWMGVKWSQRQTAKTPNAAFESRVRANYVQLCPEMHEKYPGFLFGSW